ncbi:Maltokinase [Actinomyces bovis]|uniref:Maltokinase n=1 Tax=Actinomyces bovis TaxID=1658 RepID=A0ABY1VKZ7_9ACTO|nr:phosphotransferase [Actinomyces bovis]SPT52774.1 Maltokinase [Actinomyces bovis]VEG54791.1 Maltokinase [Actinomyces israelii]
MTLTDWPEDQALLAALDPWLRARRWFPIKGAAAPEPGQLKVATCVDLADGVRELVLAVPRGDDPAAPAVFLHVPLVLDAASALTELAVPGEADGNVGTLLPADAVGAADGAASGRPPAVALVEGAHHPAYWRAWAHAALEADTVLGPQGAQAIAQRAERLRVTTGEQSNTSVVMPAPRSGEPDGGPEDAATGDLIVKVIRVLEAGRNPDVEVPVALARSGWDRVRRPVAWSALPLPGGLEADAAVACAFVPVADDGFELFCALAAQDAGPGSVSRERATALARDLGVTTAEMHEHLAQALGTQAGPAPVVLAERLQERARWALKEVPELAERLPGIAARVDGVYAQLAALNRLPEATRVHGDYHLGQVLLAHPTQQTPERWYVLDFEGEPLRPLTQRLERDQPLRDVAGMLRSFDYAAAMGQASHADWLPVVRQAFMEGLTSTSAGVDAGGKAAVAAVPTGASPLLLTALELDKALYEAVYEARNRPTWLGIPVAGLERLLPAEPGPTA